MNAWPRSGWTAVAVSLLFLSLAWSGPARAQRSLAADSSGEGPTVPILFIPGYAAASPTKGKILSYTFRRGAPPQGLDLSASYKPFVRSLENAGYEPGKTFFGAVYDWRMPAAPDDGVFDGELDLVTAHLITKGTYEYAVNYVGYWLYDPMRQRLMPTNDFLTLPGGSVPININSDPSLRSDVALDLNAGSTPGNNPWATKVGIPGGAGGVIATFATGARAKTSVRDFFVSGLVNDNPFLCAAVAIDQLGGGQGSFLPLEHLLEPTPAKIPVTQSAFPRVGDTELTQQLNGDGNGFMDSYLSTLADDPAVRVVTWGNGKPPSVPPTPPTGCLAASAVPDWPDETNYPVYHDVFFYNPDVRTFIVATLTGQTRRPEVVITPAELVGLLRFLNGRL